MNSELQVQQLMSVDLLRQDKKWKEILTDIRYTMTEITAKVNNTSCHERV